jgi:hypothetical protein
MPRRTPASSNVNDMPPDLMEVTAENFNEFLEKRRMLMAARLRDYYESL